MRGVVLAGGRSSRFGSDKSLAFFKGKRLLDYAIGVLVQAHLPVTIIRNVGEEYLKYPCVKDVIPNKGPLGGVYTALKTFPWGPSLVVTCDMPCVSHAVINHLMNHFPSGSKIVVISRDGVTSHPFPGIYHPSLANTIKRRIERNQLSMTDFIRSQTDVISLESRFPAGCFLNVNFPEDAD